MQAHSSAQGDGHREEAVEANQPAYVFPTQHDFRAGAWQLFEGNLLSSPCAKLFLRSRIERLGLSFADTGDDCSDALSFVAGYVRDVERVGLTGNVRYHLECRSPQKLPGFSLRDYRALERQYGTLVGVYHHWGLDGDPTSMGLIQNRYFECLVDCVAGVFSDRGPFGALCRRAPAPCGRDGLVRQGPPCRRRGTPPWRWCEGDAGANQVWQCRACVHRGVSRLVHEARRREGPWAVLHVALGSAGPSACMPRNAAFYSPLPVRPLRCRKKLVIENHV